jgi:choline dehydrogenase-like flavoprotein
MTEGGLLDGYQTQRALLLSLINSTSAPAYEILNNNAGALTVAVMHPLSRGTCMITSTDPFVPPAIDPHWLSDPTDRAVMLAALKFNEQIITAPAMDSLEVLYSNPPLDADDAALEDFISSGIQTEYHVSGTTAMMPEDLGGVVDTSLRVYSTENLRIVDAGVFPMVPGGHLQAVVYAVAEKVFCVVPTLICCA